MDVYGQCGDLPCPKAARGHDYCFEDLSANHSFYLAFENSNCVDYITEKFWRTLTKPTIPIVMGGGHYKKEAPPHSYIDVNDFPSVKSLADYLKQLLQNKVNEF